ncbi:helix-turn-helix domain-containing protein [Streptomyces sp. NPDC005202]|uniref:helix-turn-helix domain-containing protein n=1 Tax=Streptomyces sp. NPDC005202 TaxID=3157021 RepID=UPI0033A16AC0
MSAATSATGSPVSSSIVVRAQRAGRLPWHTDLPAAAVGERLGFPDTTLFTRFFRRRTGETPAAYRARARGTGR